jgi:hypothetical protein
MSEGKGWAELLTGGGPPPPRRQGHWVGDLVRAALALMILAPFLWMLLVGALFGLWVVHDWAVTL